MSSDAAVRPVASARGAVVVDGVDVVLFDDALSRLRRDFPGVTASHLRSVLIAEWEASTGGWPIVVPADVELGAKETLLRDL